MPKLTDDAIPADFFFWFLLRHANDYPQGMQMTKELINFVAMHFESFLEKEGTLHNSLPVCRLPKGMLEKPKFRLALKGEDKKVLMFHHCLARNQGRLAAGEDHVLREIVYNEEKFRKFLSLTIGQLNATYTAVAKESVAAAMALATGIEGDTICFDASRILTGTNVFSRLSALVQSAWLPASQGSRRRRWR